MGMSSGWTGRLFLYGRERDLPAPEGRGAWVDERVRWRVIRDGLAEAIAALPPSERSCAVNLGREWAYACSKLEGFDQWAGGVLVESEADRCLFGR